MTDITIWRATIDSKRKMNCVECGGDDQCIATQTPIAVKVYFPSGHPAFRKSLGSNVEARCERCGKIHVYDINHWEICGEPVQSSEQR